MICFVFSRVDGVLRGPILAWAHACVVCLSVTVLGLVGGAPGGGATCASLGAGPASPPSPPCFAQAYVAGAELFHQTFNRMLHQGGIKRVLKK